MSLLKSQLRRKLCYFTILVLACFDLVVVVILHPMLTITTIQLYLNKDRKLVKGFYQVERLLVGFSMFALLTMTIERYLALVYPFFHERFVTKGRLMVVFLLLQLTNVITVIMPEFEDEDKRVYKCASNLTVCGTFLFLAYFLIFKIYIVAKRLEQRAMISLGNFTDPGPVQRKIEAKKHKVILKKISTCMLVVVCITVCFGPRVILYAVLLIGNYSCKGNKTIKYLFLWTSTFKAINSTLNCLIFFYKNSTLRRHGKTILTKFLRKLTRRFIEWSTWCRLDIELPN